MENPPVNLLDEFSVENFPSERRRKLLPVWIKIFVWIFMIMGGITVPVLIIGLLGLKTSLALYGLETNEPASADGALLLFLFIYKGVVAAMLWFERRPAVTLAIFDAILGIVICLWVMIISRGFVFKLELLALVPYLVKMINLRKRWEGAAGKP
jgi:hypothetical protein